MEKTLQKDLEKNSELLTSLVEIIILLNTYVQYSKKDSQTSLNIDSSSKKKKKSEDYCISDATAINTLKSVLAMLEPFLIKNNIFIAYDPEEEKYLVTYKGHIIDLVEKETN